ncbi:MAG: hypothetical protein Unbinned8699contig1000_24 [Prokaryotic dsDNA virus sp.]|nr:MAG: hypothetical protein Unbinned8699contig1000_24 [Prokaryotic dsDNA virus sp.]|tara:strand:+ start:1107 stop:1460 length:354 start_codon:yes stop_codon:yes gene_type:complete
MTTRHPNEKDCPNCGNPMAWKNLEKDRCLKCDPFPEDSPRQALMNPAISAELLSENRRLRQRIEDLEQVATSVRRDLILRAEPDWDGSGQQVVNLSASIWDELNRVLDIKGNRREGK